MKKIIFVKMIIIISTCLLIYSCQVSKPYTKEMKTSLQKMYKEDQDIQKFMMSNKDALKKDSIEIRKKQIFDDNYKTINSYFDNYGYPGIKENGEFTSFAFWLIVQHCDNDVDFQNRVLKQMTKNLKNNNVSPKNYAYLYDRVMKNKGKKQKYGTQMVWDTLGNHSPYNIEDPKNINDRRKSVGLETIEEYLSGFKTLK